MGKAERETVYSFILREKASGPGNTMSTGDTLVLHGSIIAKRVNDRIMLTLAGFPSMLTRQRLNTMLNCIGSPKRFWQENGQQYFGVRDGFFQPIADDQWVSIM